VKLAIRKQFQYIISFNQYFLNPNFKYLMARISV